MKILMVTAFSSGICGVWTRTLEEFTENVTVDGKEIPRFEYLGY